MMFVYYGIIGLVLIMVSGVYGFFLDRNKIFPYKLIKSIFRKIALRSSSTYGWALGVYKGAFPFGSNTLIEIPAPTLTAPDVTDVTVTALADPFIIRRGAGYYLFFEAMKAQDAQGVIALAESRNGTDWKYRQVVLTEPFHLSYPYVFQWQDEYYMVPESNEDYSVRLYRATDFPTGWKFERTLLKGYHFADPSIIHYKGTWWMFVSTIANDALNLYYADDLMGPWTQHPQSPIVRKNRHISRPAGRLLTVDGKLYRFAQDDVPSYGARVHAFEITTLTRSDYAEIPAFGGPVVKASGSGWNADAMHHVDALALENGEWLAVVDGFREARALTKLQSPGGNRQA